MDRVPVAQDQSAAWLLDRAEKAWATIRDALLHPEGWDDQEWQGEVAELGPLYGLVHRVRPATREEEERLSRLLEDIVRVVAPLGLAPPRP